MLLSQSNNDALRGTPFEPAVLCLGWSEEEGGPPAVEALALCLLKRQGGLLLAVPSHFFDEELLNAAQTAPLQKYLAAQSFSSVQPP